MGDLTGLVALVTGTAGNIGAAICAALLRDGAVVIATDLQEDRDRKIIALDVTTQNGWGEAMQRVAEEHGRLDILVNNAGIAPVAHIVDTDLALWRRCMAINVEGSLLGMQAALPLLLEGGRQRAGGASVINIASAAANRAAAMTAAYCTSKAALVMLSKVAAVEFGQLNQPVRVNTINPGAVESDMIDGIVQQSASILGDAPSDELQAGLRRDVPMGRLARPDDIADAAAWLASSASRFVTGTELHVDGGFTAR